MSQQSEDKPAKVPVKRARKPQGKFQELPADSKMEAKGPSGFKNFRTLYNRPAAPPMHKEGEDDKDNKKMEVHASMLKYMTPLLLSCQPSGQTTIHEPTLLLHWKNTVQTTVSTRTYLAVTLLLDDLLEKRSDHARRHISLKTTRNAQCYQCMKIVGQYKCWQHMDCFAKEPKSVLKFLRHPKYGFICPACYSSGHT